MGIGGRIEVRVCREIERPQCVESGPYRTCRIELEKPSETNENTTTYSSILLTWYAVTVNHLLKIRSSFHWLLFI